MVTIILLILSYVIKVLGLIFNHLFIIPLTLLFGAGKYIAFGIAVIIDQIQLIGFYKMLNQNKWKRQLIGITKTNMMAKYKIPGFMLRLNRSWKYLGVAILAFLPVYSGGMFAAVCTAYIFRLKNIPGYISMTTGSVLGAVIWTIGVINVFKLLFQFLGLYLTI